MKLIDLTGRRFGRLLVIEKYGHKGKTVAWLCKCDCGTEVTVRGADLRRGVTQSCGCLHKEDLIERNTRHGLHSTRLYNIWGVMVQRCYNPNTHCYDAYGGRGIEICREWRDDFQAFYEWSMKNGYKENLTIDRMDNDKGYSPDNCRWVTRKVQANNTRRNHYITYNGETRTLSEWAGFLGFNPHTLGSRIYRGRDINKALTTPLKGGTV